jgi:hypothetical protein
MTRFLDRMSEQRRYLTTQCTNVRSKVIDARVSGDRSEASFFGKELLWRGGLLVVRGLAPVGLRSNPKKNTGIFLV